MKTSCFFKHSSPAAALLACILALGNVDLAQADTFYVSSGGGNAIMKYSAPGVGSVFASGGLINGPSGMAFDSAGNLFVGNYFGGNILKFTPDGTGSIFAVGVSSTPYG